MAVPVHEIENKRAGERHLVICLANIRSDAQASFEDWQKRKLKEISSRCGVLGVHSHQCSENSDFYTPGWMRTQFEKPDLPIPYEFLTIFEIEGDLEKSLDDGDWVDKYQKEANDFADSKMCAVWAYTQSGETLGESTSADIHHILVVFSNQIVGAEVGFEDFYNLHLAEVLETPGFLRAKRFWAKKNVFTPSWIVNCGDIGPNGMPFQHCAIYEVESGIEVAMSALSEQAKMFTTFGEGILDFEAIAGWRYVRLSDG